jgi:hypothetical protein
MNFLPPYIYAIAISFLASLTVYLKLRASDRYLRLFPPFLLATLLAELLAITYLHKQNIFVYNFFTTFEFFFYLRILSLVISRVQAKRIIRISAVLYVFAAVINIFFIQKTKMFHTITYAFGCLLVVTFCIYYFLELFRLSKSVQLKNNPAFWICSGLLFFYCCGFPLYGLINVWSGISKLILKNFDQIVTILNIFLYSLFTIAFLCIRSRKYTLSQS